MNPSMEEPLFKIVSQGNMLRAGPKSPIRRALVLAASSLLCISSVKEKIAHDAFMDGTIGLRLPSLSKVEDE